MQLTRLGLLALSAIALASAAPRPQPLDAIARDYVQLSLEAGVIEPGYVDAYYGPPAWQAAAKATTRTVAQLQAAARVLRFRTEAVPVAKLSPLERQRRALLIIQLAAAETRMAMRAGRKFSFDDEAEGLFAVRPKLSPLASYDPVLAEVETLLPGAGPLWERVENYRTRFVVPRDKLDAVMRAAIAECRRRTEQHIALPKGEKFTLEFVTGKPWSGYNYYQGGYHSLIQVNTDLPVQIDRAVDLGCHEGYPGHHVYNLLIEQRLTRGQRWTEFSVQPLFAPFSLIAEGSANYGIELAFPGIERAEFEARVLYPLAGIDASEAPRYAAILKGLERLSGARFAIAREYLDGRIDRPTALALSQKYSLLSVARASKSLDFDDTYRSYVINYGLGRDMVRAKVEAAGPGAAARWREMERILSTPMTPAELLVSPSRG